MGTVPGAVGQGKVPSSLSSRHPHFGDGQRSLGAVGWDRFGSPNWRQGRGRTLSLPPGLFPSVLLGAGSHRRVGVGTAWALGCTAGIPDSRPVFGVNSLLGGSKGTKTSQRAKGLRGEGVTRLRAAGREDGEGKGAAGRGKEIFLGFYPGEFPSFP